MLEKKHLFCAMLSLLLCQLNYAQEYSFDSRNKATLQRGAKLFMNYCSGCHSLKYIRYNRMADGLGLIGFDGRFDEDSLKNNLIYTEASINDPIKIAMPPEDAKQWFGIVPPDLSLITKQRGTVWLYSYLKSFYSDTTRPFGSNNLLVPGVAMPNILEPLMGQMTLVPMNTDHLAHLLLVKEGELSDAQMNQLLQDLVTFLAYVGDPEQTTRYRLGFFVICFLFVFLFAAVRLKKIYWKTY